MIESILQDLIRIDTRTSAANETEAAVYLKKVCDRFDIENEIIEPIKGKGSFIAHIPGWDKSKKELLLLSHLDTAEFGDLSRWKFHPLSAVEFKGRIVGRGAIDCKGLVSLWLSILVNIRKSNFHPARGIIFAAVADEENGGKHGMEYLIENNELIKNCEYVIGEGGGYPIRIGDTLYYTCQNAEKGSVSYRIEKKADDAEDSKEYHVGSPLINLLKGLSIAKIYNLELLCFLMKQSLLRTHKRRLDLNSLACSSYCFAKHEGNTVLTINNIPGSNNMNAERILNKAGIHGDEKKVASYVPANYTAVSTELYQLIVSETRKASPNNRVIPYTTPGYSDNRFLRYKGKTVYGYFPLSFEDSLSGIHGYNENISIRGLLDSYRLMNNIVLRFTNCNVSRF